MTSAFICGLTLLIAFAMFMQDIGGSLKSSFTAQKMATNPANLPYHPGALRYYKEKGLEK